jgi:FkbM family methyltransferase
VVINYPGWPSIDLPKYYNEFSGYYTDSEQDTRRWMVKNVRSDWICIDAGANIGIYTVLLAELAYMGAIYAFEPTATMDLLRQNIIHRGVGNVWLMNEALGAVSGKFVEPIYQCWGQLPVEKEYNFITIDDFMKSWETEIHLIKIDVDSFEFDILRGAEKTILEHNPWIIVELNNALQLRNTSRTEVLEWLRVRGYDRHMVLDGENYLMKRGSDVIYA